jgi:hypothetical protein
MVIASSMGVIHISTSNECALALLFFFSSCFGVKSRRRNPTNALVCLFVIVERKELFDISKKRQSIILKKNHGMGKH